VCVVVVEALRVVGDRVGKDPEIVPKALGNEVEVPAGFLKLPTVPFKLPAVALELPADHGKLPTVPVVRSGQGRP